MKIDFACDSCGKSYSVKQELAGRKAKCKQCGQTILVPGGVAQTTAMPVASQVASQVSKQGPNHTIPVARSTTKPGLANPATAPPTAHAVAPPMTAPTGTITPQPVVASTHSPTADHSNKIMNSYPSEAAAQGLHTAIPPDTTHQLCGAQASNPGNIKVSKLRYARVYPKWFLIWHSLLFISAALCWFSLWFIPLVLFFALCCWLFWTRVKNQFMHGCTNPAQVLSLDPPLIATMTDLTKGGSSYPTIKISEQPLHKMSTGTPVVGQKIATIALYEDRHEYSDHWSTFDPKPVACVSSNQQQIQRVLESIEQEDWDELQLGLSQIPKPIKPGHYRVYKQEDLGQFTMSPVQIRDLVTTQLDGLKYVYTAGEFTPIEAEKMQEASAYVPPDKLSDIWCLFESATLSSGCKHGMAFHNQGIYFHFKNVPKGHIEYHQLAAAFSTHSGLEILMRDGRRLYIERDLIWADILGRLDAILDVIAGRTE